MWKDTLVQNSSRNRCDWHGSKRERNVVRMWAAFVGRSVAWRHYKRLRERLGRHWQEHLRRRLCYFSQIDRLPPAFGLVFRRNAYLLLCWSHDWHGARHWYFMIKFWTLLHETFNWICRKYATTNNNSNICLVFVAYSTKSSDKQIRQKPFGSKNVFKAHPGYETKSISSK